MRRHIQSTPVGAEGEIKIVFTNTGAGNTSDKAMINRSIETIQLTCDSGVLYQPKCNY